MMQYDTYQGGLNPLSRNHYTYAHNNPVNLEDPSGNFVGWIKRGVKGIIRWGRNIQVKFSGLYQTVPITYQKINQKIYNTSAKYIGSDLQVYVEIKLMMPAGFKLSNHYPAELQILLGDIVVIGIFPTLWQLSGALQEMIRYIDDNEIHLEQKHIEWGMDEKSVDALIQCLRDLDKQVRKETRGTAINSYEIKKGNNKGKNAYYRYLRYILNPFSNDQVSNNLPGNNNKGPSSKIEEYWVPVYISHGENKTVYK